MHRPSPEAKAFAFAFTICQLEEKGIQIPANANAKFITLKPHKHVIRAVKISWNFGKKQHLVTLGAAND